MAVASFGACHQTKAFAAAQANRTAAHQHHDVASAHSDAEHIHDKHAAVSALGNNSSDPTTQDGSRVKCASCAACHLCSALLSAETDVVDIPTGGSVAFPESEVPRIRNVASGLERPPRA
jgi:hypothetical protein